MTPARRDAANRERCLRAAKRALDAIESAERVVLACAILRCPDSAMEAASRGAGHVAVLARRAVEHAVRGEGYCAASEADAARVAARGACEHERKARAASRSAARRGSR